MAPGMLHCDGGRGPNVVPAYAAVVDWVERGVAPDRLVAIKFTDDDPAKAIVRSRPLCPYPQVAEWDGAGDRNRADGYRCVAR
jgi:feruloyl esterase